MTMLISILNCSFAKETAFNSNQTKKQTSPHSLRIFLRLFDSNKDGNVDQKEFTTAAKKRFLLMDQNNDNKVSKKELNQYLLKRRMTRRLKLLLTIDLNKDKSVSLQEYLDYKQKKAKLKFQKIDTNQNGEIEKKELLAFPYSRHRRNFNQRLFKKLDLNSNGTISNKESMQAWLRWFKKLDHNRDNIVSRKDQKVGIRK